MRTVCECLTRLSAIPLCHGPPTCLTHESVDLTACARICSAALSFRFLTHERLLIAHRHHRHCSGLQYQILIALALVAHFKAMCSDPGEIPLRPPGAPPLRRIERNDSQWINGEVRGGLQPTHKQPVIFPHLVQTLFLGLPFVEARYYRQTVPSRSHTHARVRTHTHSRVKRFSLHAGTRVRLASDARTLL